ncbi:MAG TPA: hypothetical protein ENI61_04745 [Ignavibacteria bacterium]|nr:hypothetical protein [Ignavibacteria bacterium]
MDIYKDTKIYVLLPAGVNTAGPEFLHQLSFYLRNYLNYNTYLYCIPIDHITPIPQQYAKYHNLIAKEIEDEEKNIIISPEIFPLLKNMHCYTKIRKIIWWLSIDNYFLHKFLEECKIYTNVLRGINKTYKLLFGRHLIEIADLARGRYFNLKLSEEVLLNGANYNICSAKHVERTLNNYKLKNVTYISELLNEEYLNISWDPSLKENVIAYNPTKGISFTTKIRKNTRNLKFVAIKNMTREEVINLLKIAKVYIDFGNHPGRDRLPREAAVLGCCVITSKRGGAELFEDLSIKDEYKFNDNENNISQIILTIKECINNYEEKIKDFYLYSTNIKEEPKKFLYGLKEFFVKIT